MVTLNMVGGGTSLAFILIGLYFVVLQMIFSRVDGIARKRGPDDPER